MKNFFKKFRIHLKNVAFAAGVFLAVFAILYYRTSWNTKPVFEKASGNESSFAGSIKTSAQSMAFPANVTLADYTAWAKTSGLAGSAANFDSDPDGDGLLNYLEFLHGTDPKYADTDNDGYTDLDEIAHGYDPASPGNARPKVEIALSKIGVTAPMIWSKSENEKDQLADLQNGVAHFSGTASPGRNGNMIISGHSSNYIWAKGNFNYIFKNLNGLAPGDVADIKTVQQNGKVIDYRYKVTEKFTTVANDARIFENSDGPTLTLSTCWPLGTNLRRLIVKGELVN